MDDQAELIKRVRTFLGTFEGFFHEDWSFTASTLFEDEEWRELFIAENGTFLDPFPGEHFTGGKGDNWCNRSHLLAAYRELRAYMISEGLYTDPELLE